MNKEVDIEEIKRTLKDADMYDNNLTNDELRSYYTVLKNSENTANQEEETRKLNETFDKESANIVVESDENDLEKQMTPLVKEKKGFVPKSWFKNNVNEKQKTLTNKINSLEESKKLKDATKIVFGFNEMSETLEKNDFHITKHDLKFIPIQCTATFLNADVKTKAKIIYAYHSKIHAIRDNLARESFLPLPTPKAIVNVNHFPSSTENIDYSETYISRSGRQTKRKIYIDENSLDNDFETTSNKKTKNVEADWFDKTPTRKTEKSGKPPDKNENCNIEVAEIDININEENLDNASLINSIYDEAKIVVEKPKNEVTKSEYTLKATTSTTKPYSSKKLTNSDIMQKSKLFKDTTRKGPRCEILFDKLVEEKEKKKKEEKAMSDFEKTLEQIDDDEESLKDVTSENETEEIIDVEDEPKRRRVIPPIPGRRPINSRRNTNTSGLTPLSVVIESISPKSKKSSNSNESIEESVSSTSTKKRNYTNKKTIRPTVSKKSATSNSQNNSQQCPICNVSFAIDKIEDHAANCGVENEVVTRSAIKLSKITCEICDTVIPLSTAYEVHVKDCIRAKQFAEDK